MLYLAVKMSDVPLTLCCILLCCLQAVFGDPVDPKIFRCEKNSPRRSDWSNDVRLPIIPLTHIFCGQVHGVTPTVTADGFHALTDGRLPPCAQLAVKDKENEGKLEDHKNRGVLCCTQCYTKILDEPNNKQWVFKEKKPYDLCFFPTAWGIPETVQHLQAMYEYCSTTQRNRPPVIVKGKDRICVSNYAHGLHNSYRVHMYFDTKTLQMTTAFVKEAAKDDGCSAQLQCNYPILQQDL